MQSANDFTKQGYANIMKSALKNGYILCPVKDSYKFYNQGKSPIGILRHDVDVDMQTALEMAKLEASLGVHSTYFMLLHEKLYNPSSQKGSKIVKEIAALKHEIGFHINSDDYLGSKNQDEEIKKDIKLLASVSGQKIVSVAHHRPNHINTIEVSKYFENDAYSEKFSKNFTYVSDSCMKWRQHTPLDIIKQKKNFQFLSHPIWWIPEGKTVQEKVESVKSQNKDISEELYDAFIEHILGALKER